MVKRAGYMISDIAIAGLIAFSAYKLLQQVVTPLESWLAWLALLFVLVSVFPPEDLASSFTRQQLALRVLTGLKLGVLLVLMPRGWARDPDDGSQEQ